MCVSLMRRGFITVCVWRKGKVPENVVGRGVGTVSVSLSDTMVLDVRGKVWVHVRVSRFV